jgi:hypothetical protein
MKKLYLVLVLSSFYSFSQDSLNVKKPKLSVIALDKIKVVYRGISNPITIAVPSNVKSFIVSGPGVSTTDIIGKYNVRPGSGNELIIKVEMTLQDNSVVVEEHVYEIVSIPMHETTINGNYSTFNHTNLEFKIDELKDAEIGVNFIDCFFITCEVTQFNIKIPRYNTITVDGNKITNTVFEFLKVARKKDIILISEIKGKYYGFDGFLKNPPPLDFKIIK